jgi:hypothetical protein
MNRHAVINWELFQLNKWEWKQDDDLFIVSFNAPTYSGPWPEKYSKEVDIAALTPETELFTALNQLKYLVCKSMDWEAKAGKLSQIVVVGIEFKRKATDIFEVYLSFEYTSKGTGITSIYKKGAMFTSVSKMKHSLDERGLGDLDDFQEELRLFMSRQKGQQGSLFSQELDDPESETVSVKMMKN